MPEIKDAATKIKNTFGGLMSILERSEGKVSGL